MRKATSMSGSVQVAVAEETLTTKRNWYVNAKGLVLVALVLVATPLVSQWLGEPYFLSVATRIVIMAIASIGVHLLVGTAGLASLGHALYFGLGAYLAVASVTMDGPFSLPELLGSDGVFAWPIVLLIVAAISAGLGYLCLRARGFQFIMITLAFAQMMYSLVTSMSAVGGDEGMRMSARHYLGGVSLETPIAFYSVCALILLFVMTVTQRAVASRFGAVVRGCRQNERRMKFLGYRTGNYLLVVFIISAVITALAGVLYANFRLFASPTSLSWMQSGEFLIILVLGGLRTKYGPLVGAVAFVLLEQVLSAWFLEWQLVLGVPLLLVVLFARSGIVGLVARKSYE